MHNHWRGRLHGHHRGVLLGLELATDGVLATEVGRLTGDVNQHTLAGKTILAAGASLLSLQRIRAAAEIRLDKRDNLITAALRNVERRAKPFRVARMIPPHHDFGAYLKVREHGGRGFLRRWCDIGTLGVRRSTGFVACLVAGTGHFALKAYRNTPMGTGRHRIVEELKSFPFEHLAGPDIGFRQLNHTSPRCNTHRSSSSDTLRPLTRNRPLL